MIGVGYTYAREELLRELRGVIQTYLNEHPSMPTLLRILGAIRRMAKYQIKLAVT